MTGSPSPWDFALTNGPITWPSPDDGDIDVALTDPEPVIPPEFTFDTDPDEQSGGRP